MTAAAPRPTPVTAVSQYAGRNAEQQRGQKGQQAHQRHIRRAACLPEHIDPKAEACQPASNGGDQFS